MDALCPLPTEDLSACSLLQFLIKFDCLEEDEISFRRFNIGLQNDAFERPLSSSLPYLNDTDTKRLVQQINSMARMSAGLCFRKVIGLKNAGRAGSSCVLILLAV